MVDTNTPDSAPLGGAHRTLTVDVLLALKDRSITGLPIHDAVLVNGNFEAEAKDIMIRVFREHVGMTPEVSVEYP